MEPISRLLPQLRTRLPEHVWHRLLASPSSACPLLPTTGAAHQVPQTVLLVRPPPARSQHHSRPRAWVGRCRGIQRLVESAVPGGGSWPEGAALPGGKGVTDVRKGHLRRAALGPCLRCSRGTWQVSPCGSPDPAREGPGRAASHDLGLGGARSCAGTFRPVARVRGFIKRRGRGRVAPGEPRRVARPPGAVGGVRGGGASRLAAGREHGLRHEFR